MKIKEKITLQGIDIFVVLDGSTLRTVGRSAPVNSRAIDLATGTMFRKIGALDTDWLEDAASDSALQGIYAPSGFKGKSNSSISHNETTRELTLTTDGNQVVYVQGHRLKPSTQSVAHDNVTGTYYFYLDIDGTLQYTNSWSTTTLLYQSALIAVVYWNAEQGKAIVVGEERHGMMDPFTHEILHTVFGSQYVGNGLALGDFTPGKSNRALDDSARFSVSAGQLRDEDNLVSLTEVLKAGNKKVIYRDGSDWKIKSTLDSFPILQGSLPEATGTRPNYNLYSGGVWSLAEVPNKDVFLCHVIATNGGVYFVAGTDTYGTVEEALSGASSEIAELFSSAQPLPAPENFPIASVVYTAENGGNTVSAYVEDDSGQAVFDDWRTSFPSSRGVAVSNHAELINRDAGVYQDGGHTYLVPRVYTNADPDTGDDVNSYKTGTIWINNTTGDVFIQTDGSEGAARWRKLAYRETWSSGTYLHKGYITEYMGYNFIVTSSHISGANFLDNADKVTPFTKEIDLVNSASHGLTSLDVVRYSSGSWSKALANAVDTLADPPSIVIDSSTNWFIVSSGGKVTMPSHGLTVDQVYFLSSATAGLLSTTEGTSFSNPVLKVLGTDEFTILNYRPSQIL